MILCVENKFNATQTSYITLHSHSREQDCLNWDYKTFQAEIAFGRFVVLYPNFPSVCSQKHMCSYTYIQISNHLKTKLNLFVLAAVVCLSTFHMLLLLKCTSPCERSFGWHRKNNTEAAHHESSQPDSMHVLFFFSMRLKFHSWTMSFFPPVWFDLLSCLNTLWKMCSDFPMDGG